MFLYPLAQLFPSACAGRPVLSLCFLDVYGWHYIFFGHWHNYFLQPMHTVRASAQPIFLRCLCAPQCFFGHWHNHQPVQAVVDSALFGHCHNHFLQLVHAVQVSAQSIFRRYLWTAQCFFFHWHNYFLQPVQAVLASAQSILLRCLWVPQCFFGHLHNYFLQPGQVVWASAESIFLRCLWMPLCFLRPLRGAR